MIFYFWQNLISPHQAPLMRELADRGHQVTVVTSEAMSEERRAMGWEVLSLGYAKVVVRPDAARVSDIVHASSRDSIHLIAGARGTDLGSLSAAACSKWGRKMGIITEAPDKRGLGGFLRWLKYTFERFTRGSEFDFILAMGQMGVQWFKMCGYPSVKIFPFTYITESILPYNECSKESQFCMLFVGRLLHLKGVDLLLLALSKVPDAKLLIIGEGPEEERLRSFAKSCGVWERVSWLGGMNSDQIAECLCRADILVLPSRKDGWGAVVNEALIAGLPVICSNACGAADLIQHPWLGSIFRSNDASELTSILQDWADKGKRSRADRMRIAAWASCIRAPSIAVYFENIISYVYLDNHLVDGLLAPWKADVI